MTFLLPFYLIQARGLSPTTAGLVLTAQPLVMALTAPFSGALSDRIGARIPSTVGMLVIGLGVVLFTSPNMSAAMGAAPRRQRGIASGVMAAARNLGMVLGIGVAGAMFTTLLAQSPDASPADVVVRAANTGLLAAPGFAALGAITSAAPLNGCTSPTRPGWRPPSSTTRGAFISKSTGRTEYATLDGALNPAIVGRC